MMQLFLSIPCLNCKMMFIKKSMLCKRANIHVKLTYFYKGPLLRQSTPHRFPALIVFIRLCWILTNSLYLHTPEGSHTFPLICSCSKLKDLFPSIASLTFGHNMWSFLVAYFFLLMICKKFLSPYLWAELVCNFPFHSRMLLTAFKSSVTSSTDPNGLNVLFPSVWRNCRQASNLLSVDHCTFSFSFKKKATVINFFSVPLRYKSTMQKYSPFF